MVAMRMESEGWILSLQIDNSLSHWRWQRAFIQLGNQWWWLWWQEARHACLIEEIRFAVNGAALPLLFQRHARMARFPAKNHGSNHFVGKLRRIFQESAELLPIMSRFAVFVSVSGHPTPLPTANNKPHYERRNSSISFPSILRNFSCPGKDFLATDTARICYQGRGEVSADASSLPLDRRVERTGEQSREGLL
jgi:hypothetical protein